MKTEDLRRLRRLPEQGLPGEGPDWDSRAKSGRRSRAGMRVSIPVWIVVALVLWGLLAYHWVIIGDTGFVVLKKTSWTFDRCVIIEQTMAMFALHHPLLTTRLALGQGLWVFGNGP